MSPETTTRIRTRHWAAAWASALLTGSRVFSALAVNKIIALYLGPGGLAVVGQFQNFTAMVFGITSGNISNAVITTVSGARGDDERRLAISTATILMALGTGCVAVLIGIQADSIAATVLSDASLGTVVRVLSVAMVPLILNVVVLAVLAGTGHSRAFVALNVIFALASIPVCWGLVRHHGLAGALLSAIVVNACALLVTVTWVAWRRPFPLHWTWSGWSPLAAGRLLRLAAMTLSTIMALPAAQYLVRRAVIDQAGLDAAGQWQAALKTGEVLQMGAAAMVSLYFLPRFSGARSELSGLALRSCGLVIAGLAVVGTLLVLGGEFVLTLLFTRDFSAARQLLPLQLIGDVMRGGTVVLQAAFMVRLGGVSYVAVDLVYAVALVGAGFTFVPGLGATGAATAVVVASSCALGTAAVLMRRLGRAESRA